MAWTCHGSSNADMVSALRDASILQTPRIEAAMAAVDRALFVLNKAGAYLDAPQTIGHAATISAPHMHAYCLELLERKLVPGCKVLDVGSGSGYLTAVMAGLVCSDTGGLAVGVEHIDELVHTSRAAVSQIGWARQLVEQGRLVLQQGDGRRGAPAYAPFDAIHVGAAAPQVPEALLSQLAPGGRLLVPVGPAGGNQEMVVVDRSEDGTQFSQLSVMGVRYVPLTSKEQQRQYF